MNALIGMTSSFLQNSPLLTLLINVMLKSFVILLAVGALSLLCRRASAATRHLIWLLGLASLPALVLLACWPRAWQAPLWPVSTGFNSGNQFAVTLNLGGSPDRLPNETVASPVPPERKSSSRPAQTMSIEPLSARISVGWLVLGILLWTTGAILGLGFFGLGHLRLRSLRQRAAPLESPEWASLLEEICQALHLHRPVRLLQSHESIMPLTWGWRNPVVLLPAEAEAWTPERRRLVLLHELAHVKRWDCLTQALAQIICCLFWVNPLVWLAAWQLRVERERACDDLVLEGGWKASDYATQLVEIARSYRAIPQTAGIAMARSSQLRGRIASIVDATQSRRLHASTVFGIVAAMVGIVFCVGGSSPEASRAQIEESQKLRKEQLETLKAFAVAKEKQSRELLAQAGEKMLPEFKRFFASATNGDWKTVTSMYADFKRRHPQYNPKGDTNLWSACWSPVLEICLVYDHFANGEPKYTAVLVEGMVNAIPPGSIFFGGTDPGRGIPTAFSKSHANGDPFFTLSQNPLADGTYLLYLRRMYGGKIYTPSDEDLQKCFQEYQEDAKRRLEHDGTHPNEPRQVKPGEDVRVSEGKVQVHGQVQVMMVNALIAKVIFDKNPDREFYIEESFPLEWMYPHLVPHKLILKINREPVSSLPQAAVDADHEYWKKLVAGMLGDWLDYDTPVSKVSEFVDEVYVRKNLRAFEGDPLFVNNDYTKRVFSKHRSTIAGIYAWRAEHATDPAEKSRMTRAADLAFRQAFALCPYAPEAAFRYVNLLVKDPSRLSDALLVAETAARLNPKDKSLRNLADEITRVKKSMAPGQTRDR